MLWYVRDYVLRTEYYRRLRGLDVTLSDTRDGNFYVVVNRVGSGETVFNKRYRSFAEAEAAAEEVIKNARKK